MANADRLRNRIRNQAAAAVRFAGHQTIDALRRDTPRSDQPGAHTADRWTVEFTATSPTRFVATIRNAAETDSGIPLVTILDKGSRPHIIRPRRVTALRFYAPRMSRRADGYVFAKQVNHPGTPAFAFLDRIVNRQSWSFLIRRGLQTAR